MSFGAIVWKDARAIWRTRDAVTSGLLLVILMDVVAMFAIDHLGERPRTAAALLWLPLVFGGVAVAGRHMANEADQGTLDLLRLSPVPLGLHGVAATMAQVPLLLLLAMISMGAGALLWGVQWPIFVPVFLFLGVIGVAIVATLTGALACQAKQREALLPLLALPLMIPLLQAGVQGTLAALAAPTDLQWSDLQASLGVMIGYDLLAAGAAWLLWPFVLEGE